MSAGTGLKTALAAGVKSKTAAIVLAAALAAGTAGGATAAASQGAFGQQVKAQVAACKSHLTQGAHGIGDCVSDFAQQHGAQERQQHSQSGQNHPGNSGQSGSSHGSSGRMVGHPAGRQARAMARGTANRKP
jgi:hypothetical protein